MKKCKGSRDIIKDQENVVSGFDCAQNFDPNNFEHNQIQKQYSLDIMDCENLVSLIIKDILYCILQLRM